MLSTKTYILKRMHNELLFDMSTLHCNSKMTNLLDESRVPEDTYNK